MEAGIQVSSLKPLLSNEDQVRAAFRAMRELGCTQVQLQWIDPSVSPELIAEVLRENDMVSQSVQDFYQDVLQNFDYYTELNRCTGGQWLCVSRIPERLKTRAGLDVFVKELRAMSQRLEALGQKLCFHPVSKDFTAVAGMDSVDYLLEAMPELDICLDLYQLSPNCDDMPGFIRHYGDRICMLHFKDGRNGRLVPAGSGEINWTGVVEACLDVGIPWAFVEQETWDQDPYLCLGQALDWLNGQIRECGNG